MANHHNDDQILGLAKQIGVLLLPVFTGTIFSIATLLLPQLDETTRRCLTVVPPLGLLPVARMMSRDKQKRFRQIGDLFYCGVAVYCAGLYFVVTFAGRTNLCDVKDKPSMSTPSAATALPNAQRDS